MARTSQWILKGFRGASVLVPFTLETGTTVQPHPVGLSWSRCTAGWSTPASFWRRGEQGRHISRGGKRHHSLTDDMSLTVATLVDRSFLDGNPPAVGIDTGNRWVSHGQACLVGEFGGVGAHRGGDHQAVMVPRWSIVIITCTPLADLKSVTTKLVPVSMIPACSRLTSAPSTTVSLSGRRPIQVAAA
jgi:hypothetical protein